jgi:hypothetical protein
VDAMLLRLYEPVLFRALSAVGLCTLNEFDP